MPDGVMATAAFPLKGRVLRRRDDGSALVDVPILKEFDRVNFSRSEGGGPADSKISIDDMRQMVANFRRWGKPVAFGFGEHQSIRSGPQPVFVTALRLDDGVLIATMDMNARAANLVLDERAYRASSIEGKPHGYVSATAEFEGWILTGGVFTNNPALDTVYEIAASAGEGSGAKFRAFTEFTMRPSAATETDMANENAVAVTASADTVSLSFHEAKLSEASAALQAKESQIRALTERAESLAEQNRQLRATADDATRKADEATERVALAEAKCNRAESEAKTSRENAKELRVKLTEADAELSKARSENLSIRVKERIVEAIEAGCKPALFEGADSDPAAWMSARFVSYDAFSEHCTLLASGITPPSDRAPKSGHDPSKPADPSDVKLSEKDEQRFRQVVGKGAVDFGAATDEATARKIAAAASAK